LEYIQHGKRITNVPHRSSKGSSVFCLSVNDFGIVMHVSQAVDME